MLTARHILQSIATITLLFFISSSSIVHADRKSEYLPTGKLHLLFNIQYYNIHSAIIVFLFSDTRQNHGHVQHETIFRYHITSINTWIVPPHTSPSSSACEAVISTVKICPVHSLHEAFANRDAVLHFPCIRLRSVPMILPSSRTSIFVPMPLGAEPLLATIVASAFFVSGSFSPVR